MQQMMVQRVRIRSPLRDTQEEAPVGYCRICGGELWSYDPWPLCEECKEQEEET